MDLPAVLRPAVDLLADDLLDNLLDDLLGVDDRLERLELLELLELDPELLDLLLDILSYDTLIIIYAQ